MATNVPDNILKASNEAIQNILPNKSFDRYMEAYKKFIEWRTVQNTESLDEEVFLAYFGEASRKYAPTSLWSTYSMLKSTINCNHNVNIAKYARLQAFLKKQMDGFKSKKATVFSPEEVRNFLLNAPDSEYLAIKTVTVFGISGACRGVEITNVMIDHVVDGGSEIIVRIPHTKTKQAKVFPITGTFVDIVRRYIALRPINMATNRFFILYRGGRCFSQPIGKNTIAGMPQRIAEYLQLANPATYTGHSFRRTSTTILADAGAAIEVIKRHGLWKSTSVAEGYMQESIGNKRKISATITNAIDLGQSGDAIESADLHQSADENKPPNAKKFVGSCCIDSDWLDDSDDKEPPNAVIGEIDSVTGLDHTGDENVQPNTVRTRSDNVVLSQSVTKNEKNIERHSIKPDQQHKRRENKGKRNQHED